MNDLLVGELTRFWIHRKVWYNTRDERTPCKTNKHDYSKPSTWQYTT